MSVPLGPERLDPSVWIGACERHGKDRFLSKISATVKAIWIRVCCRLLRKNLPTDLANRIAKGSISGQTLSQFSETKIIAAVEKIDRKDAQEKIRNILLETIYVSHTAGQATKKTDALIEVFQLKFPAASNIFEPRPFFENTRRAQLENAVAKLAPGQAPTQAAAAELKAKQAVERFADQKEEIKRLVDNEISIVDRAGCVRYLQEILGMKWDEKKHLLTVERPEIWRAAIDLRERLSSPDDKALLDELVRCTNPALLYFPGK